ncbi:MAG: hypothetical protein JO093_01125 [Acidobacteria bacterium]|nr:hypothetical protein [Acidobacteriota bacterium]MBV9069020.1 hypothetical protein [Acidobacteriota bacterium]MBV9184184.1 hypothetical protein [Acidobacteriota bacterium]
MSSPSVEFNRAREHGEYVTETDNFIKNDLLYAKQIVAVFHRGEEYGDVLFARSAEQYLTSLGEAFELARREVTHRAQADLRQRFLDAFPDLMRNLITAVMQRNETRPPRTLSPSRSPAPSVPSDVTLEYSVTIRAGEAVNEDYHACLRPFYGPDRSSYAPLINLAGSTAATLQTRLPLAKAVAEAQSELMPDDPLALAEQTTTHLLNLSCITLPRWSSQHVRTYAFAAHEHMHRVLRRVEMLVGAALTEYERLHRRDAEDVLTRAGSPNEDRAPTFHEVLSFPKALPADDRAVVELYRNFYAIYFQLWGFFRRPTVRRDVNALTLQTMAWLHTIELLADAGAIVLAGPAFAFAYRTVYTPDTATELKMLGASEAPRHPPTVVRTQLHIALLRTLGFNTAADRLEAEPQWKEALADAQRNSLLRDYFTFLTKDVYSEIDYVIDLIGSAGAAPYDLRKRTNGEQGSLASAEQTLNAAWLDLAHGVETQGKFMPNDMVNVRPADALNAIWYKRMEEGDADPKNRLAWRVALRNCNAHGAPTT